MVEKQDYLDFFFTELYLDSYLDINWRFMLDTIIFIKIIRLTWNVSGTSRSMVRSKKTKYMHGNAL